ncbi:MAG: cation transporter [Firmicutes bacterium]|nr:cation transporter [Bacillota bacterium]
MVKTVLKIDGMMCGMCEAHICDAIREAVPSARKVTASRSKKTASFLTEETVSAELIKSAVDATGYQCLEVRSVPYNRKKLFGII